MSDREFEGFVPVEGGRLWAQWAGEGTGVVLAHAGIADVRMWDPQWAALGRRPPRRPLRPAGLRPGGGGARAVLEPGGPRRGDGRRRAGPRGARGVLAGRVHRRRHGARVPGPRDRPGLGLRRARRRATSSRPPEEQASVRARRGPRDGEGLGGAGRPRRRDLGRRHRASPPAARPRRCATLVRRMTYETYVQEKAYGDPIALDPPAADAPRRAAGARCSSSWASSTSPATRTVADVLVASVPGARRVDLPDVPHLPNLERPEWFTETLLGVPRGGGLRRPWTSRPPSAGRRSTARRPASASRRTAPARPRSATTASPARSPWRSAPAAPGRTPSTSPSRCAPRVTRRSSRPGSC